MTSESSRRAFILLQILTGSRIPLALIFAALVSRNGPGLSSFIVLVVIESTDLFDGRLARRFGLDSAWGRGFDPYADSFARLVVYWALAVAGLVWATVPLVMALRDLTVAYSRTASLAVGATIAARTSGKAKALVQGLGAVVLIGAPLLGFASSSPFDSKALSNGVSIVVLAVTLVSAVDYSWAALAATRGTTSAKE